MNITKRRSFLFLLSKMPSKNARLQQWLNYRVRVVLQDSRMLVGTFLAFDRHMNVVLADTEEFRKVRTKNKVDGKGVVVEEKELKRTVGFILLRGNPPNLIPAALSLLCPEKRRGRTGS